jgi:hypothetical protein
MTYGAGAIKHLLEHWYDASGRELRGCHPRDLVEAILDYCRYESRPPVLSVDVLNEVCTTYFLRPMQAPQ